MRQAACAYEVKTRRVPENSKIRANHNRSEFEVAELSDFVGDERVGDERVGAIADFHVDARQPLARATYLRDCCEVAANARTSEVYRHRNGHTALCLFKAPDGDACGEIRQRRDSTTMNRHVGTAVVQQLLRKWHP